MGWVIFDPRPCKQHPLLLDTKTPQSTSRRTICRVGGRDPVFVCGTWSLRVLGEFVWQRRQRSSSWCQEYTGRWIQWVLGDFCWLTVRDVRESVRAREAEVMETHKGRVASVEHHPQPTTADNQTGIMAHHLCGILKAKDRRVSSFSFFFFWSRLHSVRACFLARWMYSKYLRAEEHYGIKRNPRTHEI